MEPIPDKEFVTKWLSSSHFKESMVNDMLIHQFNYFTNRRQIDKFHVWLFKCANQVDLSFQVTYFPNQFKCYYGEKIIKAPPLQTIETWKHFLEENIVHSPVILELFICFLNHLRLCDDLVPKMVIPQENQCIQSTRDSILNLPFKELKNHEQLALILRLSHAWGNLILLKNFYNNEKFSSELVKHAWYDLGPIHDYYEADVWKAIVGQCLSSSELSQVIFDLIIQKLSFFNKTMYTENESKSRSICANNVKTTVDHILTKVMQNPAHLESLNLWKFSTFVPDELIDKFTQIIVNGAASCESSSTNFQFSSTIDKGCERSTFVLSIIKAIIQKFIDDLDADSALHQLFVHLKEEQFFQNPPEILDPKAIQKLRKLLQNVLTRDKSASEDRPAFKTLAILEHIPLGYLQDEAQLKCSIFLTSLSFSFGLTSTIAKLTIPPLLLILKSTQTHWFFQAYDPDNFFKTLIDIVHKQISVPVYLSELISLIIIRLFKDYPREEIVPIIEGVLDQVVNCNSHRTSRCLTTLLLKGVTPVDCPENDVAITLITHLLEMLRDSSIVVEFNQAEINETLLVIMDFFSKKKRLTEKEQKLLKKFTSVCTKLIKKICASLFDAKSLDCDNYESNIKFLVFLCSTSQSNDLLSVDKLSKIWLSMFPNYPEIDYSADSLIDYKNCDELFNAVPVISKCIFGNTDATNLSEYVDYCFSILKGEKSNDQQLLVIYVLKGLIAKEWTKNSAKDKRMYEFNDSIMDKLLHRITSIMKDQNISPSINLNVIQACGDLIKDLLHVGKDLMTSPRLYYCLQSCTFLPLRRLTKSPEKYTKVLTTYHAILSQFFSNYNFMVISSMIHIKDLLQSYLSTLTEICNQSPFSDYDKTIQKDLVNNASDLNKLISQLNNDFATDFSPFSPQLISCYISLNHRYTIHPEVKKHLILCVYRLLNIIKSSSNWKDIYDMIHCRLDESGRDLLKILYENYEKFYVFKGRF